MFPLCLNEALQLPHSSPAPLRRDPCHFPLHKLRLESSVGRAPNPFLSPLLSHGQSFHRIQGFTLWGSQGCFYSSGVQKAAPLFQVFYKHSSRGSSLPWRVSAFAKTRLIGRLSKQGREDMWEWGQASHPTQVPYSMWRGKYKEQSGHPHLSFLPLREKKPKNLHHNFSQLNFTGIQRYPKQKQTLQVILGLEKCYVSSTLVKPCSLSKDSKWIHIWK